MRPVSLPSKHYAFNWETETIRPVSEVNDLGKRYAETEEGRQKENLLLELCQAGQSPHFDDFAARVWIPNPHAGSKAAGKREDYSARGPRHKSSQA